MPPPRGSPGTAAHGSAHSTARAAQASGRLRYRAQPGPCSVSLRVVSSTRARAAGPPDTPRWACAVCATRRSTGRSPSASAPAPSAALAADRAGAPTATPWSRLETSSRSLAAGAARAWRLAVRAQVVAEAEKVEVVRVALPFPPVRSSKRDERRLLAAGPPGPRPAAAGAAHRSQEASALPVRTVGAASATPRSTAFARWPRSPRIAAPSPGGLPRVQLAPDQRHPQGPVLPGGAAAYAPRRPDHATAAKGGSQPAIPR